MTCEEARKKYPEAPECCGSCHSGMMDFEGDWDFAMGLTPCCGIRLYLDERDIEYYGKH